ncbi:uncharacterized protein [Mytilus edulis]|uniref:uncharacterized protein n=1 Tax=Mytilus edulis TaxID=6550 RepID=UPI0039F01FEC
MLHNLNTLTAFLTIKQTVFLCIPSQVPTTGADSSIEENLKTRKICRNYCSSLCSLYLPTRVKDGFSEEGIVDIHPQEFTSLNTVFVKLLMQIHIEYFTTFAQSNIVVAQVVVATTQQS